MKFRINLQNYVTKGIHHKVIEAENIDKAFDEARELRDASQYFIIYSVEEL